MIEDFCKAWDNDNLNECFAIWNKMDRNTRSNLTMGQAFTMMRMAAPDRSA